jgi:hypothetical protein
VPKFRTVISNSREVERYLSSEIAEFHYVDGIGDSDSAPSEDTPIDLIETLVAYAAEKHKHDGKAILVRYVYVTVCSDS